MKIAQIEIEEAQKAICRKYGVTDVPAPGNAKTGFALSTKGRIPINGMRHPVEAGSSGWFIWCGEAFSEAGEFFASLHTHRVYEEEPGIASLMGLPPGYRFLSAGDYLEVWYDGSLLNV